LLFRLLSALYTVGAHWLRRKFTFIFIRLNSDFLLWNTSLLDEIVNNCIILVLQKLHFSNIDTYYVFWLSLTSQPYRVQHILASCGIKSHNNRIGLYFNFFDRVSKPAICGGILTSGMEVHWFRLKLACTVFLKIETPSFCFGIPVSSIKSKSIDCAILHLQ